MAVLFLYYSFFYHFIPDAQSATNYDYIMMCAMFFPCPQTTDLRSRFFLRLEVTFTGISESSTGSLFSTRANCVEAGRHELYPTRSGEQHVLETVMVIFNRPVVIFGKRFPSNLPFPLLPF